MLFYLGIVDPRIMVMDYSTKDDSFSPGRPRLWSDTQITPEVFDLMPDGKRIVVLPAIDQKEPTHATFLLNFFDDLRRLVPTGK
jgi:hypothetical protein